jgi:hypothetical protein
VCVCLWPPKAWGWHPTYCVSVDDADDAVCLEMEGRVDGFP